ncbi:MAG: ATP-dependent DNA helicase, RecQ-like [Candidatus Kentron sp. G]|nr:MAG: ATP-dependent DNA helicase, RecQ-like [Candidatus Kentron sp. G]VFM98032.1 MAG: ATP-dependent DNA helicase, RecQ-like [Candidatus Kentron sp. G]VFM99903.1 MAG: ATP-dependent DNA helicase, RecQ-like [Candidatus Kentron sp. G]
MKTAALQYLRTALGNPRATFRAGQWESIEGLLARKRMLVVQRTGWGKSMVYFLASRLMRDQGSGPALLISPLLSLMRNQLEAAHRVGIRASTINSTNNDEWDRIQQDLIANRIDILLISPERLGNDAFRRSVLSAIADRIGLLVIDEAHCISDWGHDFRPDYRRIVRILTVIPPNVPVLATTATANNRVVEDVISQLGDGIELVRGPLVRESLRLQNIDMPDPAARMAWLAQTIPTLTGSGIVYTLTQRDAEQVAEWLGINGVEAKAYHAGLPDREDGVSGRAVLEQQLLDNEIKVLVATVALGMGFDKPDIGFVIHFQRPASVVHYYQQVGRAGRAVDEAYGILLCGKEDDHIADWFIQSAFPPQQHIDDILGILDGADDGLSLPSLEEALNLKRSQIDKTLRLLTVESPSPVTRIGSRWYATPSAGNYRTDRAYVEGIIRIRRREQEQMRAYMAHRGCLMAFLEDALDDPNPQECHRCRNCDPEFPLTEHYGQELANRAERFLQRRYQELEPRRRWPGKVFFQHHDFGKTIKIPPDRQASRGRALSLWGDAGWGALVAKGKQETGRFDDALVDACVQMLADWRPGPQPQWVTCVPALAGPGPAQSGENTPPGNRQQATDFSSTDFPGAPVTDFAGRLALALQLPFFPCVRKIRENPPQKTLKNSLQKARNLDGVFRVELEPQPYAPCLLVDDTVGSRWTFTVVSALLRQAGCVAVYPLALALDAPGME